MCFKQWLEFFKLELCTSLMLAGSGIVTRLAAPTALALRGFLLRGLLRCGAVGIFLDKLFVGWAAALVMTALPTMTAPDCSVPRHVVLSSLCTCIIPYWTVESSVFSQSLQFFLL
jgi:hypothetical protein